jgi:hypothetical protein
MLLKRNGLALCIFGFLGTFYMGGAGAKSQAAVNVAVLPLTNS